MRRAHEPELSRRAFLSKTGQALTSAATVSLLGQPAVAQPQPRHGGTLRFATRSDVTALDPHRNIYNPASTPLAATTQGLLDLNLRSEPVPGIAYEWEASRDLRTYTFKLRKGALFHNGREIDAAAVQWNLARMLDPSKAGTFTRSALTVLRTTEVLDKYTIRCHLHRASAAFPANVVYYPCNLIAPDSEAQAGTHPIGCGPFKFVSWSRYEHTRLERFENYFETDAAGNPLPYLEAIEGRPKKEDRVRLTALRIDEVDLIDSMAYADAKDFSQKYAGKFQAWPVPIIGTAFITFNLASGPFMDKRVRQAAAHAIDRDMIHQAVFHGQGAIATGFYAPQSPWYTPGVKPWPAYDPEQARSLLRQARALGTEVLVQAQVAFPYMRQISDLLQTMWSDIGLKVTTNMYDQEVVLHKRRAGDFHADVMGASYRFDPDGWFARVLYSAAPATKDESRFQNARADQLIIEAGQTAEPRQRLDRYTEVENIVNEELPILYLHHLTVLEAGSLRLRGYQPALSGPFSVAGGGIRTAWMA
ncbi:MAG: ABC transporter substrate-binding protein [Candidatus Tectimicrobiota bacterium]